MDSTQLVAALGLALGAASLAWQAATHVLTGGRLRVMLRVGAIGGHGLASAPPDSLDPDWFRNLTEQGFTRPVVAVRVANVGRMHVTVVRWSLVSPRGTSLSPIGDSIGPTLPHRLEPGESETWAVDFQQAQALTEASKVLPTPARRGLFAPPQGDRLYAEVELGDGRKRRSDERL